MLQKTHKATRKALKQGIKVSFSFNSTKGETLIILCHDTKTGKLLNSWARESKYQTDELLAKAINRLVKRCKKDKGKVDNKQCNPIVAGMLAFLLTIAASEELLEYINEKKVKSEK